MLHLQPPIGRLPIGRRRVLHLQLPLELRRRWELQLPVERRRLLHLQLPVERRPELRLDGAGQESRRQCHDCQPVHGRVVRVLLLGKHLRAGWDGAVGKVTRRA